MYYIWEISNTKLEKYSVSKIVYSDLNFFANSRLKFFSITDDQNNFWKKYAPISRESFFSVC